MTYQVIDWDEHFEGSRSRRYKNKSHCQMPTKHGLGFRRIISMQDGPAIFGAWCDMIQILSRHPAPRQGHCTDTGRNCGAPLVPSDLQMLTGIPENIFSKMFQVCSSQEVGWLRTLEGHHEGTAVTPRGVPFSDSDSDSDLDLDLDLDSSESLAPARVREGSDKPISGFPRALQQLLHEKGHPINPRNIDQWRGVLGELKHHYPDAPLVEIFEWAMVNYTGPVKKPRFFVEDTWPTIFNAWKQEHAKAKGKDYGFDF